MNNKLWLLAVLLLTSFNLAEAQQPVKLYRIGYLEAVPLLVVHTSWKPFGKVCAILGTLRGRTS
jgi:hypothetical protein